MIILRCTSMRTTIRLDDELLERLKAQARRENVSLTGLVNRTLRAGLQAARERQAKRPVFREQPISMGAPRTALDTALARIDFWLALENVHTPREIPAGKARI